jgi:long-chain acyl-CoA synthetase
MALLKTAMPKLDLARFDTWPKVLQQNSTRFGDRGKAMRYKHYGIWQSYSWQDYYSNVKYLALGLLSLGFKPGSRLLVVGDNYPEWYFAELAAQSNRGISVGLYSDLSAAEIEHIARDCEADFAMVEDEEQADKILQIRERLPGLKKVVYWRYKGLSKHDDGLLVGLRSVQEKGREYEAEHPGAFEENVAAGKADDICAIVYTSGTTADAPKGALHSHRSLMSSAECYREQGGLRPKDDLACYLPPAWITEQCLVFGGHLLSGGTINFAEGPDTQQEDVREIAPSLVQYNSRLWESLAGQVQARMRSASILKRVATRLFMPVGYKMADLKYAKRTPGPLWRLLNMLADLIVFRPVRDSMGLPHARVCYTSGAVLSPEAIRFFHALRVPLKNAYGSAEAGLITGAAREIQSQGTVGSINLGTQVMVTGEGEISVRHPGVFLGYHHDAEMTARVLVDGWAHTGDKGYLNDAQELVYLDRLEDAIALPCGAVHPQDIESRLKYSPYIKDAWVLAGERCDFVSAVIIVDPDTTGHWADKHKINYTTFGDLVQKPEIDRLIEGEISQINQGLPDGHQIKNYVSLHKEFDPDESELTRNYKLRRKFLAKRYPEIVHALSGDDESVEVEAQFTYQDGRSGKIKTALKITTIGGDDR